ncbi:MAG: 5'/3'-nucleotidase SurE [Ignavibacteriaceae bacterium]|nr:5'/3'-nucleotidase SurE [Ignavibacteriaceae bacterium]
MRILISNDDGIHSPGIFALAEELKKIAEVTVVAPAFEQSAVGHAITMKVPVRVAKYYKNNEFFGYAVDGTPADCVKMGIRNIMEFPPDIVVSGINHGSNTATNVIYSGTVSAAREAAIMDFPAIAVSVTSHDAKEFGYAARVATHFSKLILSKGLNPGTLLNINVPDLPEDRIKGICLTKQGRSKWDDIYEKRLDPYGKDYYWLTGNLIELDHDLSYDQFCIKQDYVSVSPIHFDLTDHEEYSKMASWEIDKIKSV